MHVDDGVGGGDFVFKQKIDELQKTLPFGSRKFDSFTFTGIQLRHHQDGSIQASQGDYAGVYLGYMSVVPVAKTLKRRPMRQSNQNLGG